LACRIEGQVARALRQLRAIGLAGFLGIGVMATSVPADADTSPANPSANPQVSPQASPQAQVQPILVLAESNGWGAPSGPWPYGLRLVVYADGQIIYSPDPEELLRHQVPRYFHVEVTVAAARRMADAAATDLAGLPEVIRGDDNMTDQGWTTILVWRDGALQTLRHAYAHPCKTAERDFQAGSYQTSNRAGTDQRFLDLCDRLATFTSAAAVPWQPRQLMIRLQPGDGDRKADWPADWGPQPPPEQVGRPFCIGLGPGQSRVTDLLVSDQAAARESAFQLAVMKTPRGWWEIGSWQYPLPGEIAIHKEGYSPRPLFTGSCDSEG
jgi:hypothetical protein